MPAHPSSGSPPAVDLTRPRRRRRIRRALLALAAIVAGTLPLSGPAPASASGGRPSGPLVPSSGFYVGAYTKHPDGYSINKQKQAVDDLETRLGRRLHIDHQFYAWEDDFPTWREPWDLRNDRIPMISWNGTNTESIASGAYDGMILERAKAVRELGQPVFLRWFWEMDGTKKADWAVSPQSYVAAWRRIHDLFAARDATNAVWVWCPNASAFDDVAMSYYPGDAYVDWVCADGYNFAPYRPNDRWRSFAEIFDHFYAAGMKLRKPMMIGEAGVLERDPGEKAQWFHDAHDTIASRFPAIAALVYFNADSTEKGIHYQWSVDTSPSAFEGFRYLFSGPAPVPPGTPPAPAPAVTEPPAAPDAAVSTAGPVPRPASPKVVRPKEPAPAPALTVTAPAPSSEFAASRSVRAAATRRTPSPRMTWVLQLLRQLEY